MTVGRASRTAGRVAEPKPPQKQLSPAATTRPFPPRLERLWASQLRPTPGSLEGQYTWRPQILSPEVWGGAWEGPGCSAHSWTNTKPPRQAHRSLLVRNRASGRTTHFADSHLQGTGASPTQEKQLHALSKRLSACGRSSPGNPHDCHLKGCVIEEYSGSKNAAPQSSGRDRNTMLLISHCGGPSCADYNFGSPFGAAR